MELEKFILELYDKNIIKTGDFVLKSGLKSNIYFDLRTLISYPLLLNQMVDMMWNKISDKNYDNVCGVAYTGIPLATIISSKHLIPMLIKRKEKKEYGTKKLIEGVYNPGDKCLLVDDLITTGSSLMENVTALKKEGVIVDDILVFIDRRKEKNDINVINVCTLDEIMNIIDIHKI